MIRELSKSEREGERAYHPFSSSYLLFLIQIQTQLPTDRAPTPIIRAIKSL